MLCAHIGFQFEKTEKTEFIYLSFTLLLALNFFSSLLHVNPVRTQTTISTMSLKGWCMRSAFNEFRFFTNIRLLLPFHANLFIIAITVSLYSLFLMCVFRVIGDSLIWTTKVLKIFFYFHFSLSKCVKRTIEMRARAWKNQNKTRSESM